MTRVKVGSPPGHVAKWPWRRAEFASLDFEATGLDFERDTIISFGVVPVRRARVDVGDSVYELVDPGEVELQPSAITVHGLRAIDLRGAPSLDDARRTLADALEGRFLLTWFSIVEASFLAKLYGGNARSWLRRSIDVRELVIALDRGEGRLAGPERYSLSEVADRFEVPVASAHNALDDALVTAQLFLIVASHLARQKVELIRDLVSITAPPPVLRRPRAPL